MRAWLTLLIVSSTGCLLEIDYSGTQFRCEPGGDCPPDHECIAGVCVLGGGGPDAGQTPDSTPTPDAAPADAAPLVCPTGCAEIDTTGVCYCPIDADWATAKAACGAVGLDLARIDDAILGDRLIQHAIDNTPSWLQGTDSAVEGEWRWSNGDLFWTGVADGSAPAGVYTAFDDLEPNQFMGTEEDCLEVRANGWNDGQCGQARTYLCQRPTP